MRFRKMRAVLGVISMILCGCSKTEEKKEIQPQESAEPAEPTAEEKAEQLMQTMSTEEKAAQLIHMAVRVWNGENLSEINDEVSALFSKYSFGGICLFSENITNDNTMTVRLTQALQEAAVSGGGIPLMISADQEGGFVNRLSGGTVTPGNMALGASGDPENAQEAADIIGSELSALGFNTDFAPVADVNANPSNPVIGVRAFSDDPEMTALFTGAYARGLAQNNIISSLKHFPGHGDTDTDSHTGLPRIDKTKEQLMSCDLIPFKRMIESGYSDMIMTAHIQYPQIEKETYTSIYDGSEIHLPATMSKTILTDIVRSELGFRGLIITDAMIMDAIAVHFDPADAAALSLNAGVDILLMPVDLRGSESLAQMDSYMEKLVSMINDGTIPESRVDEACRRILTLKFERGIMDREYSETMTEKMIAAVNETVGSDEHIAKEIEISEKAAAVLENRDVLPLTAADDMNIILCGMNPAQTNALGYSFKKLQKEGIIPSSLEAQVINGDWSNSYQEVYGALEQADVLILTDYMYSPDLVNPEFSDQLPNVRALIQNARSQGVRVIALSCGLPYDLSVMRDADGLIAVFCQIGVPACDDDYNPAAAFGPGIIGAMDVIFGKAKPSGRLPVNVPGIADNAFTDTYEYTRGTGLTW